MSDEALRALERASPDDPASRAALGQALLRAGERRLALGQLAAAAREGDASARALLDAWRPWTGPAGAGGRRVCGVPWRGGPLDEAAARGVQLEALDVVGVTADRLLLSGHVESRPRVVALDVETLATTGVVEALGIDWSRPRASPFEARAPFEVALVGEDLVVVAAATLRTYDPRDLSLRGEVALPAEARALAGADDRVVLLLAGRERARLGLACVDLAGPRPALAWTTNDRRANDPLVVHGDRVHGGDLCLRVLDGALAPPLVTRAADPKRGGPQPVASDGRALLTVTRGGGGEWLGLVEGGAAWEVFVPGGAGDVALLPDAVLLLRGDALAALDRTTGAERWRRALPAPIAGAPCAALAVTDREALVLGLTASDGAVARLALADGDVLDVARTTLRRAGRVKAGLAPALVLAEGTALAVVAAAQRGWVHVARLDAASSRARIDEASAGVADLARGRSPAGEVAAGRAELGVDVATAAREELGAGAAGAVAAGRAELGVGVATAAREELGAGAAGEVAAGRAELGVDVATAAREELGAGAAGEVAAGRAELGVGVATVARAELGAGAGASRPPRVAASPRPGDPTPAPWTHEGLEPAAPETPGGAPRWRDARGLRLRAGSPSPGAVLRPAPGPGLALVDLNGPALALEPWPPRPCLALLLVDLRAGAVVALPLVGEAQAVAVVPAGLLVAEATWDVGDGFSPGGWVGAGISAWTLPAERGLGGRLAWRLDLRGRGPTPLAIAPRPDGRLDARVAGEAPGFFGETDPRAPTRREVLELPEPGWGGPAPADVEAALAASNATGASLRVGAAGDLTLADDDEPGGRGTPLLAAAPPPSGPSAVCGPAQVAWDVDALALSRSGAAPVRLALPPDVAAARTVRDGDRWRPAPPPLVGLSDDGAHALVVVSTGGHEPAWRLVAWAAAHPDAPLGQVVLGPTSLGPPVALRPAPPGRLRVDLGRGDVLSLHAPTGPLARVTWAAR